MSDPIVQDLVQRVAQLKAVVGIRRPAQKPSWRNAVGTFTGPEFHGKVLAEAEAIREADRIAGREQFSS